MRRRSALPLPAAQHLRTLFLNDGNWRLPDKGYSASTMESAAHLGICGSFPQNSERSSPRRTAPRPPTARRHGYVSKEALRLGPAKRSQGTIVQDVDIDALNKEFEAVTLGCQK
jgi:hypothetical protein